MKVKQLELNLWDVISTARQTPEDANLPMVFELLDLTLVDLDTRSQLRIAGEAVCQIADLFCDRSNFLFEELHSRAVKGDPIMADDAFDRYVRQSMLVDFDQFIESLPSLPRKIPEQVKSGNSIVRFGLAKMTTAHAQRAKYKLARYWYIQHDALYARE